MLPTSLGNGKSRVARINSDQRRRETTRAKSDFWALPRPGSGQPTPTLLSEPLERLLCNPVRSPKSDPEGAVLVEVPHAALVGLPRVEPIGRLAQDAFLLDGDQGRLDDAGDAGGDLGGRR